MTTDAIEPAGAERTDPLEQLRERIEAARDLEPAPVPADRETSDPLEVLRRRVERAAEFDDSLLGSGPLGRLLAAVERARRETAAGAIELQPPEIPSSATGDPLQRLRRMIHREIDEVGRRDSVDLAARAATDSSKGSRSPPSTAARVGEEVLAMVAERDLPAEARAEAVRRLAAELDDPDRDALREVLRLLIAGEP